MVNIRTKGEKIFDVINCVFMILLAFLFIYPLWHCVALSFGNVAYSNKLGFRLFPVGEYFSLASYKKVLTDASILTGYANTLFRVVLGVPLTLMVTYMAAYSMARETLPLRKGLIVYFLIPMFFSGGLIPSYLNIKDMGLLGSRWVWILPGLISTYNLLVAKNFVAALPRELEEAASIDGAHPVRVMVQIMVPLSAPILAVLGLWSAVGHWNAWFDAMIYTPGDNMMVLQQVLRRMLIDPPDATAMAAITVSESTTETIKMASVVVALVPIMCVYPFVQKHFTKGVMLGAVKG